MEVQVPFQAPEPEPDPDPGPTGNLDYDVDPPLDPALQSIADSAAQTLAGLATSLAISRIGRKPSNTSQSQSQPLPALPEDVYVHNHGSRHLGGGDDGGIPQMREIQSPSRIRIVEPRPERGIRRPTSIYRQGSLNNRSFREGPVGIVEGDRIGNASQFSENDLDNFVPVVQQEQQQQQQGTGDRERESRRHSTSRRMSTASASRARSIEGMIARTLDHARLERENFAKRARNTGLALNIAIGMQVFLSALITGLSAAASRRAGIGIAILGGLGTIIASYLARARGSNEPELSTARVKDLERFIRDCEALIEDHGYEEPTHANHRRIEDLRAQFEDLLGNGDGQRKMSSPV